MVGTRKKREGRKLGLGPSDARMGNISSCGEGEMEMEASMTSSMGSALGFLSTTLSRTTPQAPSNARATKTGTPVVRAPLWNEECRDHIHLYPHLPRKVSLQSDTRQSGWGTGSLTPGLPFFQSRLLSRARTLSDWAERSPGRGRDIGARVPAAKRITRRSIARI